MSWAGERPGCRFGWSWPRGWRNRDGQPGTANGGRALESILDHPQEHVVAGAIHGLGHLDGWAKRHVAVLRGLVFDPRPAVIARALDACTGWDGVADVCYVPDIADRVAEEHAAHRSSDVLAGAFAYLSICAPDRHVETLVRGLSDRNAWVRTVAIHRLSRLRQPEHRSRAGAMVWLRLDDEDIDVRDEAQTFLEAHAWALPESDEWVPMTDDEELLAYSKTRVDLVPTSGQPVDVSSFARAMTVGQPTPVRRGAADELWEQAILVDDAQGVADMVSLSAGFQGDADPRVRQAALLIVDQAKRRGTAEDNGVTT